MDNTKVWVAEDAECRRASQYYVDLLVDNFTETNEGIAEDTSVEDIYEMLLYGLKFFARSYHR